MNNIIENNQLIRNFMEFQPKLLAPDLYGCSDGIWFASTGSLETVSKSMDKYVKYHSDWNWLHNVVDKIESLGYEFQITSGCATVLQNISAIYQTKIYKVHGPNKQEAVYNTCIEFIKWYNLTKTITDEQLGNN